MSKRVSLLLICAAVSVATMTVWLVTARWGREQPGDGSRPGRAQQQRPGLGPESPVGKPGAQVSQPVVVSGLERQRDAEPTAAGGYGFGEPVAQAGQLVRARVEVERQAHVLTPNQIGDFPQVYVAARQTVAVVVEYPEAQPGAAIVVQMMDGGRLVEPERPPGIDHDMVRLVRLDEQRTARFAVQVSGNDGMHRVVLTKGADKKQLDFWVGEERVANR
jgi:hypothetical protein